MINKHFAQTLGEKLGLETGSEVPGLQIKVSPMSRILSPFCPLNDHLQSQKQQSPEHELLRLCLRNLPDKSFWHFVNIMQKF